MIINFYYFSKTRLCQDGLNRYALLDLELAQSRLSLRALAKSSFAYLTQSCPKSAWTVAGDDAFDVVRNNSILFSAKRFHRINARCMTGWKPACDKGNRNNGDEAERDSHRVHRLGFI